MKKTAVLLPTYNEADSIEEMIKRVQAVDKSFVIYVVDSGSTDGTIEKAKKENVRLIVLNKRGKGIAIAEAFTQIDEDIAILLDSDASYLPEEIPLLLKSLEKNDIVVGSRFRGDIEKGSMKSLNRFGNQMLTLLGNTLYLKGKTDLCSGFWGFTKKTYRGMKIDAPHFELEANFFAEAAKMNLSFDEVPISYKVRQGETKLTAAHGIKIAKYLVVSRFK